MSSKKYRYIFIIWICILAIAVVRKSFQNDTFYTIKIGELIMNNGIDMMDHFSIHTLPYTYPHWLYDVFIYGIFKLGGYNGIYISTIILFIILLLFGYKLNRQICHNELMAGFTSFICVLAISSFVTARAQLVSYILFLMEIYFIESFLEKGNKKKLIGLVLVSILLCNMHVAVWPFYFILYLPYLAEYIISKLSKKIKIKKENKFTKYLKEQIVLEDNPNIKYLFITMIISILTGLFTPLGDTPYTYLIKTMMGNSQKYIQEHQMMDWKSSPFTLIIAGETIFLAFFSKVKLRDLFMICGLILMNIVSIRHMALLALIGTVCFGRIFSMFIEKYKFKEEIIINILKKRITIILSFIFVIGIFILLFKVTNNNGYISPEVFPVEATKYIKENIDIDNMRLYNDYNFGSYLILNDIPVFIDSRADLYTKPFSGLDYDIMDDYEFMPMNYTERFRFYQISHALIYKGEGSLDDLLRNDTNYKLLYEDDVFALYEKLQDSLYDITYENGISFSLKPKIK